MSTAESHAEPAPEPAKTHEPAPKDDATARKKRAARRARKAKGILAHPLLLLLVGAMLSNLLIPEWNRRSEVHQRELAVKVEVSTRVNEAVVAMVTATQAALVGARGQSPEEFDRAYMTWQVRRAVIASEFATYGQGTTLARDWEALATAVDDAYASAGLHDPARRAESFRTWGARRATLDQKRDALLRDLLRARLAPFR